MGMVRQGNKSPGEAVNVPCLQAFKASLDRALGCRSWWVAALTKERLRWLDLGDF